MTYADDERDEDQEQAEQDDEDDATELRIGSYQHSHFQAYPGPYDSEPSDTYQSDNLDMSDDGSAPLVNYLDSASIITHGINAASFFSDGFDPDMWSVFNTVDVASSHPADDGQDTLVQDGDGGFMSDASSAMAPEPELAGLTIPSQASLDPAPVTVQLGEFLDGMEPDSFVMWFPGGHPPTLSSSNPNTLGPGNYGLIDFLKHWAGYIPATYGLGREGERLPWMRKINDQDKTHLTHVQYADLAGDQCDFQGVDWEDLGVTRREARERRLLTYTNYVNKAGSDRWSVSLFPCYKTQEVVVRRYSRRKLTSCK